MPATSAVSLPGRRVLRRGPARVHAAVHGPGRRHRVAAGRRCHRVPVHRWPSAVAGGSSRGHAGRQRRPHPVGRRRRADGRQRVGGGGRRPHPPLSAGPARSSGGAPRGGGDSAGDRGGCRGQRHHRLHRPLSRRGDRARPPRCVLADVVAGGLLRWPAARAAGCRVAPDAVAPARCARHRRGGVGAGDRRGCQRAGVAAGGPSVLSGVPAPHLERLAPGPRRRLGGGGDRVRLCGVGGGAQPWGRSRRTRLADGVLHTQLFIAVATFSTLCLAAVVAERRRLGERSTSLGCGWWRRRSPSSAGWHGTSTTARSSA